MVDHAPMRQTKDTTRKDGNKMANRARLEAVLDALEEFELEWYEKHPEGVYTERYFNEYKEAKLKYVENYMKEYDIEVAEAEAQFIEDYENDPEVQYGWYQQDLIDMRRRER